MRRVAAAALILCSAGCASTNDTPGAHDSSEPPSLWKPGYAWGYRYETRSGSGTFAWIMVREETLDGTTFYVLRGGSKDIYVRKSDFAYAMEKENGEVVGRNVPPARLAPAAPGEKWDVTYVREAPKERRTDHIGMSCESSGPETITVPAGTFETLRTTCANSRTGELAYEGWFAVATRQMVRDRMFNSDGWRDRELIDISLKPQASRDPSPTRQPVVLARSLFGRVIEDGVGYAGIRIGMTSEELARAWGPMVGARAGQMYDVRTFRLDTGETMNVMLKGERVESLQFDDSRRPGEAPLSTSQGVEMGDLADRVRSVYGEPEQRNRAFFYYYAEGIAFGPGCLRPEAHDPRRVSCILIFQKTPSFRSAGLLRRP
jgi:hypothetical protein